MSSDGFCREQVDMKIRHAIRQYLANSDQTARGLALRAGLGPKAVYDILNVPGIRPRHATLERLSTETGLDLHSFAEFSARTWADLLRELATAASGRGVAASSTSAESGPTSMP